MGVNRPKGATKRNMDPPPKPSLGELALDSVDDSGFRVWGLGFGLVHESLGIASFKWKPKTPALSTRKPLKLKWPLKLNQPEGDNLNSYTPRSTKPSPPPRKA